MWPLSAWRSASVYKISPKSDNRSMSYDQKSEFQDGGCRLTVTGFNILCSVPDFMKIGRFFTEIWQFNDFSKWRRSATLDFKNLQFLSCSPCRPTVLLPHTKFRWNRTTGRWVMAKKANFKQAAAAILNFKNFNFWSRDCNRVQYLI